MLEEGDRAPGFTLDQVDGAPIALYDVLQEGHRALLILLRYLG